ncbi:MAG: hypothetical protein ACI31R_02925 [Bacilli bacterium]
MAVKIKEEYLNVDTEKLAESAKNIRKGFSTDSVNDLSMDARALILEGKAKDNLVAATRDLYIYFCDVEPKLDNINTISKYLSKYQKNVEDYRELKIAVKQHHSNMKKCKENNFQEGYEYNKRLWLSNSKKVEKLEEDIREGNRNIKGLIGI